MPKKAATIGAPAAAPNLQLELRRLEEIVRTLEGSDLDLDGAIALFEEGVGRLKTARGGRDPGPEGARGRQRGAPAR